MLTDDVFLSYQSPYGSAEGRELEALAVQARRHGFPIKIAVIARPEDLGPEGDLYGHAGLYSKHLAGALTSTYVGTLVVAMNGRPGGFGVHGPGATPAARRALARMKLPQTPPTAAELARLAAVAVQRVAAASGHHLPVPAAVGKKKTSSRILDAFLIGALALAALGGGAALLARWLRGG